MAESYLYLRQGKKPYPQIEEPGDQAHSCQSKQENHRATAAAPFAPAQGRATHPAHSSQQAA